MELKRVMKAEFKDGEVCLNRTFMELKHDDGHTRRLKKSLNRTFMELKLEVTGLLLVDAVS